MKVVKMGPQSSDELAFSTVVKLVRMKVGMMDLILAATTDMLLVVKMDGH